MAETGIRILLADDEPNLRSVLDRFLTSRGHTVTTAPDGTTAIDLLRTKTFDVALLDYVLPGADGLEVLRAARAGANAPEVIIMTGEGSFDTAIAAVKLGAYDYITKPYQMEELELRVQHAAEKHQLTVENARLQASVGVRQRSGDSDFMVAEGTAMQNVLARIESVAATGDPVLVTGERGTGMTRVSRLIHVRRHVPGPLCVVDADGPSEFDVDSALFGHEPGARPGLSERYIGAFEQALRGTVVIRSIHALAGSLQRKLLDALTRGSFVRAGGKELVVHHAGVVATTARDLRLAADEGTFSRGLYALFERRIIALPPLRERPDDIPLLAERFLRQLFRRRPVQLAPDAVGALLAYSWPGNVSELRNLLERVAMFHDGDKITAEDLGLPAPRRTTPAEGVSLPLAELERRHIETALAEWNWHQGNTAAALGISPKTLYRKIREYGFIRPKDAPPE